jgi:hypothetical protein
LREEWEILLIPEQKKLLKAKIAVDLQDELGRVPGSRDQPGVLTDPGHVQSSVRAALQRAGTEEDWTVGYPLKIPMLIGYARVSIQDQTLLK